jgi:hypothetical protein
MSNERRTRVFARSSLMVGSADPAHRGSWRVGASVQPGLGFAAPRDIVHHELHEVLFTIADHDVLDDIRGCIAWPSGLTGRSVALESGARCCYPVVEALPGVGEVAVPAEWGGAVLVGVVGAEPVQV